MITGKLNVLFDLPQQIAEGLANGTLKRKGGVIYNANGGVVAWLRETGPMLRGQLTGASLPPALTAQLQSLQSLMGIQIGLQALTLGATVAGFVIIGKKMDAISRQLNDVSQAVSEISREVEWLNTMLDADRSAELLGSLDHANWSEQNNELSEFKGLRKDFSLHQIRYVKLMEAMADRMHSHPGVFLSFYRHCALAGMAKIRCDWLLSGAEAALATHQQLLEELALAANRFVAPMQQLDLRRLIGPKTLSPQLLLQTTRSLTEDRSRVEAYRSEIHWCQSQAIPFSEWTSIGSDVNDRAVVFVTPVT